MHLLPLTLILQLLHLCFIPAQSQPNYIGKNCPNVGNYTQNSRYQKNLSTLLSDLTAQSLLTTFYNASHGDSPDQVYGLFYCRGDVDLTVCHECVQSAADTIVQECAERKEAFVWYERCTLRYANRTFFSQMEDVPQGGWFNSDNATNPDQFVQVVFKTINGLIQNAAYNSSYRGFATGEGQLLQGQTVYCLVQCIPDIHGFMCERCLKVAYRDFEGCCIRSVQVLVFLPSCQLMYDTAPFYKSLAPPASPGAPPSTSSGKQKRNSKMRTVIIIAVISTVVSLALAVLCYCLLRKRKTKRITEGTKVGISSIDSLQYDFETVKAATDNFSPANKLGHGGFGGVYKGIVSGGLEIAVKRLASNNSGQGEAEFKNEIALLAKLQHRNLVQLFGFCLEKKERILIYEFVPNGSLDHFLFESAEKGGLEWSKRRQIIGGIAQGLVYLHEHSRIKIIHRDLKPGNILLDAEMNPKIADFGVAKLFSADETHAIATKVAGTFGYMAPEYTREKQFSVKSDVYSFGILLLEIICGRKNNGFFEEELAAGLINLIWNNWRKGTIASVIDPTVGLDTSLEPEITRYIHIGLLCVQKNALDRPNISSVITWLSSDVSLPPPSFPGYISETYQPPQQASHTEESTVNSNVSPTLIDKSMSMIHDPAPSRTSKGKEKMIL